MADFYTAIIQSAAPSSNGSVSYKTPNLGGKTPKAAIFIQSDGGTLGTSDADWRMSFGVADGTAQICSMCETLDAKATVTLQREYYTNLVINRETSSETASFSQWLSDTGDGETGVELTWANTNSIGKLFTIVLFAGDDLSAHVGSVVAPSSGSTDVNTVGFQPDVILHFCSGIPPAGDGTFFVPSIGVSYNNGSNIDNWCYSAVEIHGSATSVMQMRLASGSVANQFSDWYVSAGSFDSSGFSYTNVSGNPGTDQIGHLALKIDGGSVWAGIVDSPTSTGDDSQTGPGFTPSAVLQILTMMTTVSTSAVSDAKAGVLGFSAFTANEEYCFSWRNDVGAATTDNDSLLTASAVDIMSESSSGTKEFVASYSSMDTTGWTLNYTTANGTTRKSIAIALGNGSSGSTILPIFFHHYNKNIGT